MTNELLLAGVQRDEGVGVSEVFSIDLWSGNNSLQTISNGLDMSGEGGMIWVKNRSSATNSSILDTERGDNRVLSSNLTEAQFLTLGYNQSVSSDGYSFNNSFPAINSSPNNYVGWSFRKAPNFFDVVTYTGDGVSGRAIPHDLGVTPGMIIVKSTSSTGDWRVYHRSLGGTNALTLNSTAQANNNNVFWNDTDPTDIEFTVGPTGGGTNDSGVTYVAYLFSHDVSDTGIIQCGSTNHTSGSNTSIDIGWQPQYILVKKSDSADEWYIIDSTRGFVSGSDAILLANVSNAESSGNRVDPDNSGFIFPSAQATGTYVYMAIRTEGV